MIKRITGDFNIDWNYAVQKYSAIRRIKMSQQEIADQIGVSLKSIQRFENFKSVSSITMYHYQNILKTNG